MVFVEASWGLLSYEPSCGSTCRRLVVISNDFTVPSLEAAGYAKCKPLWTAASLIGTFLGEEGHRPGGLLR